MTKFGKRINRSKAKVEVVAMDMSSGYSKWVKDNLDDAFIVFDHFHVIKLMNEKLEKIRRRTVRQLEEDDLKSLKKKIYVAKK